MTCIEKFPMQKDQFKVGCKIRCSFLAAILYCFPLRHSTQGTRKPEKNRTRRILKDGIVIRRSNYFITKSKLSQSHLLATGEGRVKFMLMLVF